VVHGKKLDLSGECGKASGRQKQKRQKGVLKTLGRLQAGRPICEKYTRFYQLVAAKTAMITVILQGSDSLSSTRKDAGLFAFFKVWVRLRSR